MSERNQILIAAQNAVRDAKSVSDLITALETLHKENMAAGIEDINARFVKMSRDNLKRLKRTSIFDTDADRKAAADAAAEIAQAEADRIEAYADLKAKRAKQKASGS